MIFRGFMRHLWTKRLVIDDLGYIYKCECTTWGRIKRLVTFR